MRYDDDPSDALRAGIATTFFLLGTAVITGVVMAPGLGRLVLVLLVLVAAPLAGLYVWRSARSGGAR
ncbi:hypothetical protein [Actinomadura terrae]|uniref:hypothetical protein n=1 Tax=Actinomadura terrae TaxID=604353 RepID=UPI001FA6BB37|nr:hypothetical protein [Actinomadura terrae]